MVKNHQINVLCHAALKKWQEKLNSLKLLVGIPEFNFHFYMKTICLLRYITHHCNVIESNNEQTRNINEKKT